MAIAGWITVSIVVLWVLVLCETGLLLLLLRALGQLRLQGKRTFDRKGSMPENWGPAVGTQAPSFTAETPSHEAINLEDYQGRKRLLLFISPTCSACVQAIESLKTLRQKEPDLELLIVGSPDYQANQAYTTEHQLLVPVLTPARNLINETYGIKAIPYSLLLDEQGVVRAKGMAIQENDLQHLFEEAFQVKKLLHKFLYVSMHDPKRKLTNDEKESLSGPETARPPFPLQVGQRNRRRGICGRFGLCSYHQISIRVYCMPAGRTDVLGLRMCLSGRRMFPQERRWLPCPLPLTWRMCQ